SDNTLSCSNISASLSFAGRATYRYILLFFFFSSRRRHTRFSRDWSSDVCSSDLVIGLRCAEFMVIELVLVGHRRKLATFWLIVRSEERRVGKECRSRGATEH